jgi:hypothetical protein
MYMKHKFIWIAVLSFLTVSGILFAHPTKTFACGSAPIADYGRNSWCGYFANKYDWGASPWPFGGFVLACEGSDPACGIHLAHNNAATFEAFIEDQMDHGDAQNVTGAEFIIHTMDQDPAGIHRNVTAAELADWKSRIANYADGSVGTIDWNAGIVPGCGAGTVNTFYQNGGENDDAPMTPNSEPDCGTPTTAIIFRNKDGKLAYEIRIPCGNPLGGTGLINNPPPPPNYTLIPSVNVTVNGKAASSAQVGDKIIFSYTVDNTGTTNSASTTCLIYRNTYANYHTFKAPAYDTAPAAGDAAGTGCPKVFAPKKTVTILTDATITVASVNQTICRTLYVDPSDVKAGHADDEACVTVAAEPYVKVFGGDVSSGNGSAVGCTAGTGDILTWNEGAATYDGAGTEYAAFALGEIYDFSTAQADNAAAVAKMPSGLAFANTNAKLPDDYGGSMGTLPCITNYYTTTLPTTGVTNLGAGPTIANVGTLKGAYTATGNMTIDGGALASGQDVQIFDNGNIYISGVTGDAITYNGTYTAASTPLFELVANGGNIYINGKVTRLDGAYISQKVGGVGGTIVTCANAAGNAPWALDGTLYNACNTKLTVNGSFTAQDVLLERTAGTLSDSAAGTDNPGTEASSAGEQFNFNPALWIAQPPLPVGQLGPNYDAIVSLPPIL